MPKTNKLPLSVLFGINKPTGPPSMTILNQLQPLFSSSILFKDPNAVPNDGNNAGGNGGRGKGKGKWNKKGGRGRNEERIKLGQGGTLDPLADGVLVVGTNSATKHLAQFLDCTKEYKAIGLFGCATDSYDSEGKRVKLSPYSHITQEKIEAVLDQYRGQISQVPPIFSALKMDGKPLYEYARNGIPLPRPIAARSVTVHALNLIRFVEGTNHTYIYPTAELPENEKVELAKLQKMVKSGAVVIENEKVEEVVAAGDVVPIAEEIVAPPPIFEISMTVSSGTYVRSIIHDIGIALGSSAHVVKLTRTRQGIFTLKDHFDPPTVELGAVPDVVVVVEESIPKVVDTLVAAVELEVVPEASTSSIIPTSEEVSESPIPVAVEPSSSALPTPAVIPTLVLETFPGGCVEWTILEQAIKDLEESRRSGIELVRNEEGFLPWEVEVLHRCKAI